MVVFMLLVGKMLRNTAEGQVSKKNDGATDNITLNSNYFLLSSETLTYANYIEIVLLHALAEGRRLLADDFSLLARQCNPTQA